MIEIEKCHGSAVVCRPSGDLNFEASFLLRHVISDIIRPGCDITIDLRHANVVDAAGLSVLVGSVRRVRAVGGTGRVINANTRVRWLMRIVGVDRLIAESVATSPQGAA
jgi:anti-anti-sigma factor